MKVDLTDTFVDRLENQVDFIAKDNPVRAKSFKIEILNRINQIPANPYLYRQSIYFEDERIRDLIFMGYTIVFRISKDAIQVFGFLKFQEKPYD